MNRKFTLTCQCNFSFFVSEKFLNIQNDLGCGTLAFSVRQRSAYKVLIAHALDYKKCNFKVIVVEVCLSALSMHSGGSLIAFRCATLDPPLAHSNTTALRKIQSENASERSLFLFPFFFRLSKRYLNQFVIKILFDYRYGSIHFLHNICILMKII